VPHECGCVKKLQAVVAKYVGVIKCVHENVVRNRQMIDMLAMSVGALVEQIDPERAAAAIKMAQEMGIDLSGTRKSAMDQAVDMFGQPKDSQ